MGVNNFIARIINWNKQRYDQEFNQDLTVDLLYEEIGELNEAATDVDKLDALIDTIYVSFGAMWKLGLTEKQITEAINVVCDANDSKECHKLQSHDKGFQQTKGANFVPPELKLQEILNDRFNNHTS